MNLLNKTLSVITLPLFLLGTSTLKTNYPSLFTSSNETISEKSIKNNTTSNTETSSLTSSSVSTFSDYPEGGWEAKKNELDYINFNYSETWRHVKDIKFTDEKAEIITILDDGSEVNLTYKKPIATHQFAKEHFNHIKEDWSDFTKNRKPNYTNYFLIKYGLDIKTKTQIDFIAYAYNRNGDPHYHGNATIIKDYNFPNKIFMRLDQLDSAKIKDVGIGFGEGGHWTSVPRVNWNLFKYFPSADTVFEVRGIDKLPLKSFYNSDLVYNTYQLLNIFQLSRFSQQETKVHINLDVDTQYTWTQPLLYISKFGVHTDYVNLGWSYDGNDDLLKRKSEKENTVLNSETDWINFKSKYKVSNVDDLDNVWKRKWTYVESSYQFKKNWVKTDDLKININLKKIYKSSKLAGKWNQWEIETSQIVDYTFDSKVYLPEHDWKSEGWTLKEEPNWQIEAYFYFPKGIDNGNNPNLYFAGESWAQKNIKKFRSSVGKDSRWLYLYKFKFLEKYDWLGYRYFIPVSWSKVFHESFSSGGKRVFPPSTKKEIGETSTYDFYDSFTNVSKFFYSPDKKELRISGEFMNKRSQWIYESSGFNISSNIIDETTHWNSLKIINKASLNIFRNHNSLVGFKIIFY